MTVSKENLKPVLSVNKYQFITWLFIISSLMLFASQTSAYLVRRAEGNWTEFPMPSIFYWSTLVLILSSALMVLARKAAKKDQLDLLRNYVGGAFILGSVFLVMQYYGWQELQLSGIYLKGNPSGSFLYILTGLHAFHIVSGLFVLLFALFASMRKKINSSHLTQIEVCSTYWHFLDILWIYLFAFLLYFR